MRCNRRRLLLATVFCVYLQYRKRKSMTTIQAVSPKLSEKRRSRAADVRVVLSRRTCGLSGRHESEDHWVSVLPRLGLVGYARPPGVQVSHDLVSAGAGLKCPESVFYITTIILRHSTRTSRSLSTGLSTLGSWSAYSTAVSVS